MDHDKQLALSAIDAFKSAAAMRRRSTQEQEIGGCVCGMGVCM